MNAVTSDLQFVAPAASSMRLGRVLHAYLNEARYQFMPALRAPAFANLVYLPGIWLSGMFFPLPKVMQPWAVIWPAFIRCSRGRARHRRSLDRWS